MRVLQSEERRHAGLIRSTSPCALISFILAGFVGGSGYAIGWDGPSYACQVETGDRELNRQHRRARWRDNRGRKTCSRRCVPSEQTVVMARESRRARACRHVKLTRDGKRRASSANVQGNSLSRRGESASERHKAARELPNRRLWPLARSDGGRRDLASNPEVAGVLLSR